MDPRTRPVAVVALVIALIVPAVSFRVAAAPQVQTPTDLLPALLAEVRALRIAMEQSAAVMPRVQLTLTRLGIEEQRITQLGAQLDQVRRQLAEAALDSTRLREQLEDVEKGIQTESDDKQKKMYGWEQTELKRKLSAQAAREQQLRERENEFAQMLAAEQARWMELNAKLDELERLLAPVR